jgi:hypothetical protein
MPQLIFSNKFLLMQASNGRMYSKRGRLQHMLMFPQLRRLKGRKNLRLCTCHVLAALSSMEGYLPSRACTLSEFSQTQPASCSAPVLTLVADHSGLDGLRRVPFNFIESPHNETRTNYSSAILYTVLILIMMICYNVASLH